jgi:RND family efflux transporter MFP subunit
MQSHEPPSARDADGAGDSVKPTDYGTDVADGFSHAASTQAAPGTGARVQRVAVIIVVALALAFVAVRGVRFFSERSLAKATERALSEPHLVDVVEARPVQAIQPLTLPGQTAAWYTATIYSRVNGYVGQWLVDIGDHVKKGQILATLETPELDAELAAARAQLKASEAQVIARTSDAEFARTTHERWRDSPQGVVSDQEREAKRADYESSVARLKAAEAQVALDEARVDQYAALAQFKRVVAPFAGVITERHIDIGNLVTAGSTTATTPLYRMTQNDPIRVFVDAPQSAAAELMGTSQKAEILTEGSDPLRVAATVARTAGAIDPQARTLRVEVDVANGSQRLLPGMYVKVAFNLAPKGLVQVPAAALVFRSDGPQVARIDAAGKVNFRKVSIARDDGNVIELASGVAPGDRLALNISSQIRDGDAVRVNAGAAGPALVAGGR